MIADQDNLFLEADAAYAAVPPTSPGARLVRAVADLYSTQYLSQVAHWNVTGPDFHQLHALFKESYDMVAEEIDDVAEQARILGVLAPASLPELLATSSAPLPASGNEPMEHVRALMRAHDMLKLKWDDVAANAGTDAGLNDLASRLSGAHAKMAWKLRSTLGE